MIPNIIRVIKCRTMRWAGMWHVWGTGEAHTKFWWGNLRKKDRLEELGVDGRLMLTTDLKEIGWECVDLIDLARIGTGGGLV